MSDVLSRMLADAGVSILDDGRLLYLAKKAATQGVTATVLKRIIAYTQRSKAKDPTALLVSIIERGRVAEVLKVAMRMQTVEPGQRERRENMERRGDDVTRRVQRGMYAYTAIFHDGKPYDQVANDLQVSVEVLRELVEEGAYAYGNADPAEVARLLLKCKRAEVVELKRAASGDTP